jgi:hypothetical protein
MKTSFFYLFLFFVTTKHTNYLVILEKQMSQQNLLILFLFGAVPRATAMFASLSIQPCEIRCLLSLLYSFLLCLDFLSTIL